MGRVESGSLLTPVLDRDPHWIWDRVGPLTDPASFPHPWLRAVPGRLWAAQQGCGNNPAFFQKELPSGRGQNMTPHAVGAEMGPGGHARLGGPGGSTA